MRRSNGVRLRNVRFDSLQGTCIRTPDPVQNIVIQTLAATGACSVEVRGSDWLVEQTQLRNLTPTANGTVTVQYKIQGHHLILRNNEVINQGPPNSICYQVAGHHIELDGNLCIGGERGVVIRNGHDIHIEATEVYGRSNAPAVVVQDGVQDVTLRLNRIRSSGPLTPCGIRIANNTSVTLQANLLQELERAYCGPGILSAIRLGNWLRAITTPEPGPTDVVE
jgi:Right handed beta helix region